MTASISAILPNEQFLGKKGTCVNFQIHILKSEGLVRLYTDGQGYIDSARHAVDKYIILLSRSSTFPSGCTLFSVYLLLIKYLCVNLRALTSAIMLRLDQEPSTRTFPEIN